MKNWHSISELMDKTGIPDATLRRYIRHHGHHLQLRKKGKGYLIAEDSVVVIEQIRDLYSSGGLGTGGVEDQLAKLNAPVTLTIDVTDGTQVVPVNAAEALMRLEKVVNDRVTDLEHRISGLESYIEQSLEKRDAVLMETLRQIAASKDRTKKASILKPWTWGRR